MATTSTTDSGSPSFVPEAIRNILAPDAEHDCVTVQYEGDRGPFQVQVANFPTGLWFNVCNFPGGGASLWEYLFGNPDPHPYAVQLEIETDLDVSERGDMYVLLDVPTDDPDAVISELRETARILGADVASEEHVKSEMLRPDGWLTSLLLKLQRGDME